MGASRIIKKNNNYSTNRDKERANKKINSSNRADWLKRVRSIGKNRKEEQKRDTRGRRRGNRRWRKRKRK
jgi:hypothetical protein